MNPNNDVIKSPQSPGRDNEASPFQPDPLPTMEQDDPLWLDDDLSDSDADFVQDLD